MQLPVGMPPPSAPPWCCWRLLGVANTAERPFRRLTPTDMMECRRQSLFYNCDKPYVHSHQCKRLFHLLITDDPEGGFDGANASLYAVLLAE